MIILSIITINLNNKTGLERTIQSVISQTYSGFEYLVIDGGSTDGSIEVIQQYADKIKYWISEPDNGIYNAMNKGITKATGEYCLFLNSGDFLIDNNILSRISEQHFSEDILYGDLMVNGPVEKWKYIFPAKLTFGYFFKDSLSHPSAFIKRKLFQTISLYNEKNKIVSDWEFFVLAIIKNNCSYKHLDYIISEFKFDGISSKPENADLILTEKKALLNKYFPRFLDDYEELNSLRNEFTETQKMRLELEDLKKSIFFKYGFRLGQKIKRLFK